MIKIMAVLVGYIAAAVIVMACTTMYMQFEGECVIQEWDFSGFTMRQRLLCKLPPPTADETQIEDRPEMPLNPFPGVGVDNDHPADTFRPLELPRGEGKDDD